jgi:hypothetical protein
MEKLKLLVASSEFYPAYAEDHPASGGVVATSRWNSAYLRGSLREMRPSASDGMSQRHHGLLARGAPLILLFIWSTLAVRSSIGETTHLGNEER